MQEALGGDSTWTALLRDLGKSFDTAGPDGLIRHRLGLYVAPAGRGKGHWRTFDITDGFGGGDEGTVIQDREGNLWFGTLSGVSRYDGETFTGFSSKDGLTDNYVLSILQDRNGHLWFGTRFGGVSRFDGRVFQNLTAKDGLSGNGVNAIIQDRDGDLWFGTTKGLTQFRLPPPSPPPVFIDAVVADRRYGGVSDSRPGWSWRWS